MESRIKKLMGLMDECEAVFISSYPNIFYYSGFTSEDAFLLISENERLLVTDSRYTIQAKEQAKGFEIVDIFEGLDRIFKLFGARSVGFEEKQLTVAEFERFNKASGEECTLKPAQDIINAPRRVKDKSEIEKIAAAEKLGDEAFLHILNRITSGVTEREIALELEFFMKKNGASALSFDTIAASGKRSAMPHGIATDKVIEKGDLLTLDFGCVFEGYCSDMTRTVAVGNVSDWQHDMYNLVLKAQLEALNQIAAGEKCSDIDAAARNIIKDAGFGNNFGHGLGHSVGIEIHENPSLSPKCHDIIENGNILTVEPGIYIEDMGGVRIEDLVAIMDGKAVNLTHSEKSLIVL